MKYNKLFTLQADVSSSNSADTASKIFTTKDNEFKCVQVKLSVSVVARYKTTSCIISIHIQNTQTIQYKTGYDDTFCLGFTGGFGRALVLLGGTGVLAELRPSVLVVEQRMLFLRNLVSAGLYALDFIPEEDREMHDTVWS